MMPLTENLVVDTVNEVLSVKRTTFEPVEARTLLAGLRLDSLDVAELFMALEDRSGCELDPESARSLERVGDLACLRPTVPYAAKHDEGRPTA